MKLTDKVNNWFKSLLDEDLAKLRKEYNSLRWTLKITKTCYSYKGTLKDDEGEKCIFRVYKSTIPASNIYTGTLYVRDQGGIKAFFADTLEDLMALDVLNEPSFKECSIHIPYRRINSGNTDRRIRS